MNMNPDSFMQKNLSVMTAKQLLDLLIWITEVFISILNVRHISIR